MSTPDMPAEGGSYIRKSSGKLERKEFTAPAAVSPPGAAAMPPAAAPAAPAPPVTSDT